MKRLAFYNLVDWMNSTIRKPLLLRGARQVGKTHLVRQLAPQFKQYVEINFEKTPEFKKVFEYDLDPVRIIRELSIVCEQKIIPGETLLFIDEIQEQPRAILALRYFYEEMPALHVIAAGSLVDFAIDQVGVPVGRLSFLYIYPLSFIEFLSAKGAQDLAMELLNHHAHQPINEAIHLKALRLLGEYMALGGMPEVVYQWITQQDVQLCSDVLHNIKNAYEQDFSKYAKKHEIKYVDLLFKQIPSVTCEHFKYTHLHTDYRKRELQPALWLLEKAGIIHFVWQSQGNGIPLGAQADLNKFKLLMHDVGLNQAILGLSLKDWFIDPTAAFINKRQMAESFVGQELLAYGHASQKQELYYWHREQKSSQAEVDYLVVQNRKVIPVEVKSGHGGSLQSLRSFLQSHTDSPMGIRFSIHDYSVLDRIHSYPLYGIAAIVDNKENLIRFLMN